VKGRFLWTITALLAAVIAIVAVTVGPVIKQNARQDAFNAVAMGDTYDTVIAAYRRPPDAVILWNDYQILYFFGASPYSERGEIRTSIDSLDDAPCFYDAMQILISPVDGVTAKAWCGESGWIETVSGNRRGDGIAALSLDMNSP
jgi:hypothetical protein